MRCFLTHGPRLALLALILGVASCPAFALYSIGRSRTTTEAGSTPSAPSAEAPAAETERSSKPADSAPKSPAHDPTAIAPAAPPASEPSSDASAQPPLEATDRDDTVSTLSFHSHLRPGESADDWQTIGGSTLVEGVVRGDCVTVGGNADVRGEIHGDCVTIGGNVMLTGRVRGDLVCIGGSATLGPTAEVHGDIVAIGGSIDAAPGARILGQRVNLGLPSFLWDSGRTKAWIRDSLPDVRLFPLSHAAWIVVGLWILLNLLLAVAFRGTIARCAHAVAERPALCLVNGVLASLAFLPGIMLLTITMVGIPLVPVVMVATFVAGLFGTLGLYQWTGSQLGLSRHPVLAVLVGNILAALLYAVPFLGLAAWLIVSTFALGIALTALATHRSERKDAVPARAVAVPTAASTPPMLLLPQAANLPPSTPDTAAADDNIIERAPFWPRLGALALDFVFVFTVLNFTHVPTVLFPWLWLGYHIAFWTWRATTPGGLILNLRVVRLDGRPIDAGIAATRAFAGVLSLVALGLGFLWVSFNDERQSWHDKLAGTTVVRLRRSTPLI